MYQNVEISEDVMCRAIPGYWMHETSGVLRPAVMAYLAGGPMTGEQIAALRAYLRQWIASDWQGAHDLEWLRAEIDALTSRPAIERWIDRASDAGIDPL
ncbi:hypothetical protein [Bradyrhizobium japonicum]|uniref:hypothetical protein n=1 Tax=Bradyrhizobium japonicum TaxID=375 RepID=UPI001E60FB09|nr:hypothetical protein [Bradyrhizobium japonicum]MCD9821230.1 hypothetical protein [Bradyrhizobium japonicum]MEB2674074.1 hypothetical protein [Bradyrhizobium japonicum]WRI93260.1 hypothetical protein R3F75_20945 [Bradyrhizobium japonicum]